MAEPDSWEDMDEQAPQQKMSPPKPKLNPNAATFSFNPSASSFTPTFAMPAYQAPTGMAAAPGIYASAPGSSVPAGGHGSVEQANSAPGPAAPQAATPAAPQTAPPAAKSQPEASPSKPAAAAQPVKSPPKTRPKAEAELKADKKEEAKQDIAKGPESKSEQAAAEANDVADGVAALKVDKKKQTEEGHKSDVEDDREEEHHEEVKSPVKGKESDVDQDADQREHLNLVFIGHVDAGKSTIGGQILYLTGSVDERTIQKYEREAKDKNRDSWYMAYIMDTNEEERAKGKTVEVGRAHFETPSRRYTVLDAPGHKNYVPNMISGASQADIGVLVISARKGEFETGFERGGQTREHAQLAKTLGVSKLVVVVNKMDEPSVQWAKERYDEICTKLTPFLKSCGYNTKRDVIYLPISGLQGVNMKDRADKKVCSWYDGPCLFEVLDALEPPERDATKPFRMPLQDKYKDMGTVVMGKIESGVVRRGDNLVVMPNKVAVKVLNIFRDADEVSVAKPGENLRIRLQGLEEDQVSPGYVLSNSVKPIAAVTEFDAQLQILELLDHKAIFTAGYKAVLHIHSIVEECEVIELLGQIDPKTKKRMKKRVLFVKSGTVVICRIQVNEPICIELFADNPQLGRFTLRDEGKTVAIGKVVKLPSLTQGQSNE